MPKDTDGEVGIIVDSTNKIATFYWATAGESDSYEWNYSTNTCSSFAMVDVEMGATDNSCNWIIDELTFYDSAEAISGPLDPTALVELIDFYGLQIDSAYVATKLDLFFFTVAINPTSEGDVFLYMSNTILTQFILVSTPSNLTLCLVILFGLFGPINMTDGCLVL